MTQGYPRYYTVNDRPVKIVRLPDGGADELVFDFMTGLFIPDRSYFACVSETGIGKDVDQLTEEEFQARVAALRRMVGERRQERPILWQQTGDGEFPYRAEVEGRLFTIGVNDFPAEPLYTLLIDGQEVEELEDWPPAWIKPSPTACSACKPRPDRLPARRRSSSPSRRRRRSSRWTGPRS